MQKLHSIHSLSIPTIKVIPYQEFIIYRERRVSNAALGV